MKLARFALPALIAALACPLAVPSTAPAAPAAQTSPTKVGVANPAKIFNEIQETKDLKAAMENQRKQLEQQDFEKQQRIKDLKALRDQLRPDAPQYAERNRDLLQATIEYQTWGQLQQANLAQEQKRQMLNLFNKIAAAVQRVATARGLDLVIAEQRPEFDQVNLDQLNVDQLRAMINSRNVLFIAPQVDVTTDVIAEMDKEYRGGAGAGGAPAPPAGGGAPR